MFLYTQLGPKYCIFTVSVFIVVCGTVAFRYPSQDQELCIHKELTVYCKSITHTEKETMKKGNM